MMGQSFGTGAHAENFTAQTGTTFQSDFSMIWMPWKNRLITPFYWLLALWCRRSERTTVGEIVEDRYGRGMVFFYTVFAVAFFVFCLFLLRSLRSLRPEFITHGAAQTRGNRHDEQD